MFCMQSATALCATCPCPARQAAFSKPLTISTASTTVVCRGSNDHTVSTPTPLLVCNCSQLSEPMLFEPCHFPASQLSRSTAFTISTHRVQPPHVTVFEVHLCPPNQPINQLLRIQLCVRTTLRAKSCCRQQLDRLASAVH